MMESVLHILMSKDDFVSGEEMSQQLQVSRTAIWKNIKKLKEKGYVIESVTNKGYRIKNYPNRLIKDELKFRLKEQKIIKDVFVYETIDSTNIEAKRMASDENISTALFVSEEQTLGRGRRGRQWVSNEGDGIYMSLLLRPNIKPNNASMLTLIAGLAVNRVLRKLTSLETKIKWPNDIVLNGKKICGILTEMNAEMDFINYVVIGIGINVNNELFDKSIIDMATSLKIESQIVYSRKEIIYLVIHELEVLYNEFITLESIEFIIDEYNENCINVGMEVQVIERGRHIYGKAIEITNEGNLLIEDENHQRLTINSGEVSVRGLYGYVD